MTSNPLTTRRFEPAGQAEAEAAFIEATPSFRDTAIVDELRASEYARLDERRDVYLDYTGGSLYAQSQLDEHLAQLTQNVYGNPHSVNPTSSASTRLVEQARAAVLAFFNASPDEYECIFTPNATGALRLVGEAYPFESRGRVPRDLRQPQLRQRDPRVRSCQGRTDGLRPDRGARPACGRRAARTLPGRSGEGRPQPLRLSRAVQLLRRQASAPVDRPRPGPRLGRDRRRRGVRPHEPARPVGLEAGLRPDLVLQAVRLSDGARRAARPPRRARAAAAAMVQRGHGGRGQRPG